MSSLSTFSRNWFKGNDTTSLLTFLEHRLRSELPKLAGDAACYFLHMFDAIEAANKFMSCLYHAALWLTSGERDTLLSKGYTCTTRFQACANQAFEQGMTRWKLQPKLHLLGEVLYKLESEKRRNLTSINPLSWSCQQDEDFVGHVVSQSRQVSVRTVHARTLSRYQVALAARW